MGTTLSFSDSGRGDGRLLRISTGRKSLGKVKNKKMSWEDLLSSLSQPSTSNETLREYLKLSKAEQDELKNVGFFVGGHCDEGRRKNQFLHEKDILSLDFDECTPEILNNLLNPETQGVLRQYAFAIYTTRKHTEESPRFRLVFPLKQAVTQEQHDALARIVSSFVDETMDSVDPTCFRIAQLMYFPSVCKDADFVFYENKGDWLNPARVLDDFGDWKDYTKLPFSEKRGEASASSGKKPEDPTGKRNLIGAFCRVYSVEDAISEFIPDVYSEGSEPGRYTYNSGSTANGAVVYDGGQFLFSNHATDPAYGHSQNAFDLVRIHLFNHLDSEASDNTPVTKMPSYLAMEQLLDDYPDVQSEFSKAKRPFLTEDDFDDISDSGIETADPERKPKTAVADDLLSFLQDDTANDDFDSDNILSEFTGGYDADDDDQMWGWMSYLKKTKEGELVKNLDNFQLIISNDPRLKGVCRKNLFNQDLVFSRRLAELTVLDKINGDEWTDSHDARVRLILESPQKRKGYDFMSVAKTDIRAALDIAAGRDSFHPVKEFLDSLEWDGVERLDFLFIKYLGCEDNIYTRHIARKFLTGAVARIYEPGCKFDFVPILEGSQGKKKSTFAEELSVGWFGELTSGFEDSKKLVEITRNCWIMEIPELKGFSKSEINSLKSFFSRKSDVCRLSYEARSRRFHRQFVFIGTTNDDETGYLRDLTGNRRYWPVKVKVDNIDVDGLRKELKQIWAEAKFRYQQSEPLYLEDPEAEALAKAAQGLRVEQSEEMALSGAIQEWLDKEIPEDHYDTPHGEANDFTDLSIPTVKRDKVCLIEIWVECFGEPIGRYTRQQANTLSKAMSLVEGWGKPETGNGSCRFGSRYGVQKAYVRKAEAGDESQAPEDDDPLSFLM